jgi:flotillin
MSKSNNNEADNTVRNVVITSGALVVTAAAAIAALRYRVCAPNEYLVKTGVGITDMAISKKTVVWPFQSAKIVSMNPHSYTFELHHMSHEKVPFNLPMVFTISPVDPNHNLEHFKNYARMMTNITPAELEKTIKGIIHGETRLMTSQLTIEEMFADKLVFKTKVVESIQHDLHQFGLKINNANIEELSDTEDNKYFTYRKQKAIEGANNQARVEVADARKLGDIGEFERIATTRQRKAEIDAETKRIENIRERDISESVRDLTVAKSQFMQAESIAKIESEMNARKLEIERMREIETARIQVEIETMRSKELVTAKVNAEAAIERAEGEAEAVRRCANATLYSELKKIEGLDKLYTTQANGIEKLLEASRGNTQLLQFYLASNSGLYVALAEKSAQAIQGLQPKINVWNTGTSSDGSSDPFSTIRNLVSAIPPMVDMFKQNIDNVIEKK